MTNPIRNLVDLLAEFPGIGPRQARRIVQFLLSAGLPYKKALAEGIENLQNATSQCGICFRFSESAKGTACALCADGTRDTETLMVVEKDVDIEGVESSGAYHGRYFVLGGLIAMARQRKNGNGPRVKELMDRIGKDTPAEIIFAFSTTPEGDYTAREIIRELKEKYPKMKMTLLGRGLSVGAEIEYADHETIRNAFQGRSETI